MARARIEAEIRGLQELLANVDELPEVLDQSVQTAAKRIGAHAEERAKAAAPVDTGALERSIRATDPKSDNRGVSIELTSDVPYALKVHETHRPAPNWTFNWGYGTALKARTGDAADVGGPGGKFFSRVFDKYAEFYEQKLAESLQQTFGPSIKGVRIRSRTT